MFNRIRNYFEARRQKKISTTLQFINVSPQAPINQVYTDVQKGNSLTFTGNNGEDIFSISANGEAMWYKEDSYNKAAELFLTYLTMQIEDAAGIIQNRIEWEKRITMAIASEAKNAPLGPEDLTNVIRKCIMYDKLKGIK